MKKNNKGAILPFVLVVLFLSQLTLFSIIEIYQNQMETYSLLKNHYQTQTLLGISEKIVAEHDFPSRINFNNGEVTVRKINDNDLQLTCRLMNGYHENRIIIVKNPEIN